VWDEQFRGFGCRVTANGSKTFILQGRPDGSARACRISLMRANGRNAHRARQAAEAAATLLTLRKASLRPGVGQEVIKRHAKGV
jgi:hypothetical protein